MTIEEVIRQKYTNLGKTFTEQQKRLWAASEALNLGHGGVSLLQRITGLSRSTIHLGIKEIQTGLMDKDPSETKKIRRSGGGRKRVENEDPKLLDELKQQKNENWNYTISPNG